MPRAKNEKLQHDVESAACALFLEQGYEATTYHMIAKAAGTTRANVQYCASRKANLVLILEERVLQLAEEYARAHLGERLGTYEMLFAVSQINFSLAFTDEGFKRVTFDMLKDRDLTEEVLQLDLRWPHRHESVSSQDPDRQGTPSPDAQAQGTDILATGVVLSDESDSGGAEPASIFEAVESSAVVDVIIMEMGGFYELLYHHLKRGTCFDYKGSLRRVLVAMAEAQEIPSDQLERLRTMPELSDEALLDAGAFVRAGILG